MDSTRRQGSRIPPVRLEAIRYPTDEGQEAMYGLRLTVGDKEDLVAELGKLGDEHLRDNLLETYVGLANNFYYFKVTTPKETHILITTFFATDCITREEAENVLSKGPMPPSPLPTTIHRLPSLATMAGSFWAGSAFTAECMTMMEIGGGLTVAAPVVVGCLTVAGTMMLFTRSSRKGRDADPLTHGLEMVKWEGGVPARRRVDVNLIVVLTSEDLEVNPLFMRSEVGLDSQFMRGRLM